MPHLWWAGCPSVQGARSKSLGGTSGRPLAGPGIVCTLRSAFLRVLSLLLPHRVARLHGAPGRRASRRSAEKDTSSRMTPFTTPPGGSGGSSCSLHRQGSASTMQRVREEKERINQLRATVRKDVQARPPAPSPSDNDGESSSSWRAGHGDSDSATRTRIESVSTPQHQPMASPQPDATQQSGFGSRTLACRTASLGCGLLAFAEWMDGHTLRGLALTLLALACMCAASGSTSHSSQLEGITQPHGVDVAAASLL